MGRLKKAINLLKTGNFKALFGKAFRLIRRKLYRIRARYEDWRIGRISVNKIMPTRYQDTGAYATESTNYEWLDKIFKAYPLKQDDVFVDVGCGEGRVLTYLYLRKFRGKMSGIELDEQVAATAIHRTKKCANIHIYHGNVLEYAEVFRDATAVYLFNPFDETVLLRFVEMLEQYIDHPLIMYYSNDRHKKVLDKRNNWFILRRDVLKCVDLPTRAYTVYRYRPQN